MGTVIFKVFRFERGGDERPRYDVYEVEEKPGMTVLEALFTIKEEYDGTLSFRYSCRGAVCGSCGVMINGIPRLACRTQVRDVKKGRHGLELVVKGPLATPKISRIDRGVIVVEPLPGFEVLKDLVVDIQGFFTNYREVTPWFRVEGNPSNREYLMFPEEREKLRPYVNCILCGICHAACPVPKRTPEFLGPAALAKAWRFIADPRFKEKKEVLERVDSFRGVWGCDTVYRCVEVCPKGVPPTQGVTAMRRMLLKDRFKALKGRLWI